MSLTDNPGDRTAESAVGGTAPNLGIPSNFCLFEGNLDPCTIVIFGASGDLAFHKLMPALQAVSQQCLASALLCGRGGPNSFKPGGISQQDAR